MQMILELKDLNTRIQGLDMRLEAPALDSTLRLGLTGISPEVKKRKNEKSQVQCCGPELP